MSKLVSGFCEVTLQARDPERLAAFYERGLGLERLSTDDDRIWLGVGDGARLGLWRPGEKEFGDRAGAHVHFAFAVEPELIGHARERLAAEGSELRGPVEHEGGDRSLYATDPEGNVIELWDFFARGRSVEALRS